MSSFLVAVCVECREEISCWEKKDEESFTMQEYRRHFEKKHLPVSMHGSFLPYPLRTYTIPVTGKSTP